MNTIDLQTVKELKASDLSEPLQAKVRRICEQAKMNFDNIHFIRDNKDEKLMTGFDDCENYLKMFHGDEFTCWGYFIDTNEID